MLALGSVALIGAGAVGSLIASCMLAQQRPFTWLIRNPQRRQQLEPGLTLALRPGSEAERLHRQALSGATVIDDIEHLHPHACLILAVKAYQVQDLLMGLARRGLGSKVLVVANGLHPFAPWLGVLEGGAMLDPEGRLITGTDNVLHVGPLATGSSTTGASDLALESMACPWLTVRADPRIVFRMWDKAARNCIVNPLTALLDIPNGDLLQYLDSPLLLGLVRELSGLLKSRRQSEQDFAPDDFLGNLRQLLERTAGNSSSMREDLRQGRLTEVRQLNMALAAEAEQLGLDCRLTRALGEAVLTLESGD